jgi:hypothetical protein
MNELIEDINKRWNDIEALTSHKQQITITITIAITNNHPQAHDTINKNDTNINMGLEKCGFKYPVWIIRVRVSQDQDRDRD